MITHSTRSLLFAPGSDERVLRKAMASEADAAIADLEDAVSPAMKSTARDTVVRVRPPIVRVNAVDTPWFADDALAMKTLRPQAIVLPKASPAAVAEVEPLGLPVIAIVETAVGLRLAYEIATQPCVEALMLGAVDLATELGLERLEDEAELLFARAKLVMDSRAAGIRRPVDAVYVDIRDTEGLKRSAVRGRSLGFGAKACVHPAQIPIVNATFGPRTEDLEWARRVVAAYDEGLASGRGVVASDGEMIDLPVVERARSMLGLSQQGGSNVG
jgi:citrate lyase beta subunit